MYDEEKGDPDTGIIPNTRLSRLPDSWRCPVCGATIDKFVQIKEEGDKPEETISGKKKDKKGILIGVDNPLTSPESKQEYGKPLGLRGIGQGFSYFANFNALSKYRIKTRLIAPHTEPIFATQFFGHKISMPVLGAPMSGLSNVSNITEEDFAFGILEGCTGSTSKPYDVHPGIVALNKVSGHGINIFKPQSQEVLLDLIRQSEKENAVAVGVDIDGAGSVNFTLSGKPVYRKTIDELRELKKSTKLPFILKGIMSIDDALCSLETRADVISISNHGGRVLDSGPGVADILPEIVRSVRETVNGRGIMITADGGVRTGFDVIKMLALGADYVLLGRPLAREAVSNGVEGVKRVLEYIQTDIRIAMLMTSCNTLEEIKETILIKGM
jgi:isopentenyl diphosphate isomerase/L-lactate dehydrogenase-like FMN-dependent dehydrogenase/rubredoxin